jgi:hypothetical protein
MKKTRVHWILFAVLALGPTAVFAQQGAPAKTEQAEKQTEAGPPKTEAQKQTEVAQPKKEETQKQTEALPKSEEQKQTEAVQPQAEEAQTPTEETEPKKEDPKLISVPGGKALGMSILGNQEAPKALVIVPWKTSELGNGPSVSTLFDDSRLPIDKEVFMRMLSYYEIRSESARPSGAPVNSNATAPVIPAPRRKP